MGRRTRDNAIDWELIEREYRLGQKSLRQMATEFSVQPSAISRKAKKEAWVQDKSAEVKALSKAQLLISNREKATEKATPTRHDIEVAAEVRTTAILSHRRGLGKLSALRDRMLTELEDCGADLSARAEVLKKLTDIDEKIRRGEREAYGIDESDGSEAPNNISIVLGAKAAQMTDADLDEAIDRKLRFLHASPRAEVEIDPSEVLDPVEVNHSAGSIH